MKCPTKRQRRPDVKLDALDHPKTLDLAARLQVELPTAIGHLELLWAFVGKKAPRGDVGKWPDGAIARACYWMGRPEVFLLALRESGFIDADETHRFTIHDWPEHAPRWVRAKLKSLDQTFIQAISETAGPPVVAPTVPTTGAPTKGREGKGSEAKGSEDARERAPTPPGLDASAWDRWHAYRREIRKPLKPVSIPAAQRELAAFGCDQSGVVEQSIAHGWQGLFPLKRANGTAVLPARRRKTADELEAEELAAARVGA